MTIDQPLPGPKLDEAIAKALGWKFTYETGATYGIWQSPDGEFCNHPPPFSTDTATAMAALEQLNKPVEEGGRGWHYMIYSPDGSLDAPDYWVEIIHGHDGEAPTLAHAAALAMLAALEAENV